MGSINIQTVILSGIAAFIGGCISLLGSYFTHRRLVKQRTTDEKTEIFNFIQALHDEIEALWDVYMSKIGNKLESLLENEPLLFIWAAGLGYFTIYDSNAFMISKIKDNDLRKEIVTAYTKAKGLIESYRLNNFLVENYFRTLTLYQQTQLQLYKDALDLQMGELIRYSHELKKTHNEIKVHVEHLLRSFRKKGVLFERSK